MWPCVSAATRRWPTRPPVAAGPEQVIPFLKHPCTLPASLAVHPYCLRSAFANDVEMGSGHGAERSRPEKVGAQAESRPGAGQPTRRWQGWPDYCAIRCCLALRPQQGA